MQLAPWVDCGKIKTLLVFFAYLSLLGDASSQQVAPNELILRVSHFWQEKINVSDRTGPDVSMSGWNPSSKGISLSWFHWGTSKSGFGIEAALHMVPFSYGWDVNYRLFPGGTSVRYEHEVKERHPMAGVGAYYGHRLFGNGRFSLNASAGLGVCYLFPDAGSYTGSVAFSGTPSYTIIVRQDRFNEDKRATGYGRVGFDLRYRFSNFNLISIGAFAQYTPSKNVIESDYVLYPSTSLESTGRMQSGLGHWGICIGYARTWGYPKISKRAARKGLRSEP